MDVCVSGDLNAADARGRRVGWSRLNEGLRRLNEADAAGNAIEEVRLTGDVSADAADSEL